MKTIFTEEAVIIKKRQTAPPIPKPQYADLKFKTEAEFQKWLNKLFAFKIEFVDTGRDLQQIWIADTGEILHSNAQTSIWVGKFVRIDKVKVGCHVIMNLENKWTDMKGLVVEQILKNKKVK